MEVAYLYSKRRSEFGKPCDFSDGETRVLESILPTKVYEKDYHPRNPTVTEFDTTPHTSETEVNTERVIVKKTSMRHAEGGWPKDVDFTEQSDVTRFRKKAEKEDTYQQAMRTLCPIAQRCMKQNNTINPYEQYFENVETNHRSEPPFAKGLAVFRDPSPIRRTATTINWHPERASGKIAVSYSILDFQDERLESPLLPLSSYIWDITNSNYPCVELVPPSPLCCLRYNPKGSDTLVGGSCNGLIMYFDLRKPSGVSGQCKPLDCSSMEHSHHDPVADVWWVSSKTGHQCASVSTDGQLMWWDTRKLGMPTDVIRLAVDAKSVNTTLGGSSLEYNMEAGPAKYLIGTEQGVVMSVNLRNRKLNNGVAAYDNGNGKHHGPIHSIQRNPTHNKYFMTVGDWTARIWAEDLKTPIVTTKYHNSYLTGGCWSPTRAGVFYVTRMDGAIDVWDFFHRQNEVAYSHKVGDAALSSISIQGNSLGGGKLVAVGDINGTVSLLEVCDSLANQQQNERSTIDGMFEREMKREKNLEMREREIKRAKALEDEKTKKEEADKEDNYDDKLADQLLKVEQDFAAMVNNSTDNLFIGSDETDAHPE